MLILRVIVIYSHLLFIRSKNLKCWNWKLYELLGDFGPYLWSIISELASDEMKKRKRGKKKKKKKKEKGNDKRGISDKHNPTFPHNQGIYEYLDIHRWLF